MLPLVGDDGRCLIAAHILGGPVERQRESVDARAELFHAVARHFGACAVADELACVGEKPRGLRHWLHLFGASKQRDGGRWPAESERATRAAASAAG